jgi:hypothetical protein
MPGSTSAERRLPASRASSRSQGRDGLRHKPCPLIPTAPSSQESWKETEAFANARRCSIDNEPVNNAGIVTSTNNVRCWRAVRQESCVIWRSFMYGFAGTASLIRSRDRDRTKPSRGDQTSELPFQVRQHCSAGSGRRSGGRQPASEEVDAGVSAVGCRGPQRRISRAILLELPFLPHL